MDQSTIALALAGLPLGTIQYFPRIGSTNVEAGRQVDAGCPDLTLIVADEQTAGRGQMDRRWFTPPGTGLAFSLILLPPPAVSGEDDWAAGMIWQRLTALGSLAVCQTLASLYRLPAQIKWPNDVLVNGRKLAGVLVEAEWEGERNKAAILGIGLNISIAAVPPPAELHFPATSLEDCLGAAPDEADRLAILRNILEQILYWRARISGVEFMEAWQAKLAYKGEWVWIVPAQLHAGEARIGIKGRILGLELDGSLRIEDESGNIQRFVAGEIQHRPFPANL